MKKRILFAKVTNSCYFIAIWNLTFQRDQNHDKEEAVFGHTGMVALQALENLKTTKAWDWNPRKIWVLKSNQMCFTNFKRWSKNIKILKLIETCNDSTAGKGRIFGV